MKKITLLLTLLLTSYISVGQTTLANKLKVTGNTTSTTATKVNVQEADGLVNTKPLSEFGTVKSVTGTDGISVADGTLNPVIGITSISQLKVAGLVTDLGNKVDKVTGERLINAIEISKLANQSGTNTGDETLATIKTKLGITVLSGSNTGDQDLSGKVDKVTGSSLITDAEIARLGTLANYTHPANHPPSIITQDISNRFVTDAEKATWNAKQAALGFTPYNATNPNGYETPTQLNARDTNNRARANHTGTQLSSTISDLQTTISNNTSVAANTIKRSYPSADETKLAGIASGATVNSTDAQLRDRTTHTGVQAISTVTGLQTALDSKQANLGYTAENVANKNAASGYAGLGTDGKLLSALLPDITISDTFVTASQAAMLALTAQTGDVAVRTDLNKSFILKINDPTVLANWQELLTPTSAVTTVFGRNGSITAQSGDYNADQITETASRVFQTPTQRTNNDATSSIQTQLNGKQASGSYETAFAKNTAFNKNFGTTTGTVGDGAVVSANTAKISFDSTSSTRLANTSGTNTGDNATNTQYSGLVSNATHTGDVTGATALTIANSVVSNAKLANMLTKTYKGRTSAATGVPEDVTVATLKSDLSLNNVPNTDFTSAVAANTAKVGITTTQANNITANNAKISFDSASSTRLANTSGTNTGDQVLTGLNYAPTSGSANYIQNGTTTQTANLNISGRGTFGKTTASSTGEVARFNSTDTDSPYITFSKNNIATGYLGSAFHLRASPNNISDNFSIRAENRLDLGIGTPISMTLINGGNVGIGTTTPTEKLEVNGNIKAGAATFSSSVTAGEILSNANIGFKGTAQNSYLYFPDSGAHTGAMYMQAGFGSALAGGSLSLFGQNHATKAGSVSVGLTATSSKFTVTSSAFGAGTELLSIDRTGAATFASSVTANGNSVINGVTGGDTFTLNKSTGASLALSGATGATSKVLLIGSNSTTPDFLLYTGGAERLKITTTGAATFSSSVTATGTYTDGYYSLRNVLDNDTDGNPWYGIGKKKAGEVTVSGWEGLKLKTSGGNMFMASTGAATFSSSVTANGGFSVPNAMALTLGDTGGTNGLFRVISSGGDNYIQSGKGALSGTRADLIIGGNFGGSETVRFKADGNVVFTGTVTSSGGFFNSDRRLKDIFKRDGDVAYYTWKDKRDDKNHIGYVAQEVQKQYPDQVQEGADGMLSVNYIEVLVAKIQDLEKRIQELEKAK